MRPPLQTRTRAILPVALVLALGAAGCGGASVDRTGVASAAVAVAGVDPAALIDALPDEVTDGWTVHGTGDPVAVTLDDVRVADPGRADHYARAGFDAGARVSLTRGEGDRIAVVVERFAHAGAAREVFDWHVAETGGTIVDGVSRIGSTAEGVVVLDDLLVRVVAVGEEAPDEDTVRALLAAAQGITDPAE